MSDKVEEALKGRDLNDVTSIRSGIDSLVRLIEHGKAHDMTAAGAALNHLITSVKQELQPTKLVQERVSARVAEMVATIESGNPELMARASPSVGTALQPAHAERIESEAEALWNVLQTIAEHISDAALDEVLSLRDFSTWIEGKTSAMWVPTFERQRVLASFERDRRSLETLSAAVTRGDRDTIFEVVGALSRMGRDKAARSMVRVMTEAAVRDDRKLLAETVMALEAIGPGATGVVANALRDDSPVVRAVAADLLGRMRDERAIPALTRCLDDPDDRVREMASAALTRIESR